MADVFYFSMGCVVSWAISHIYYRRALRDSVTEHAKQQRELTKASRPTYFDELVKTDRWTKEFIDNIETWVATSDHGFQIIISGNSSPFDEPWTRTFPDKNAFKHPVYLRKQGVTFRELSFVSIDGDRIFVPIPKQIMHESTRVYFWDADSIEFGVGKIIGRFYSYKSIEAVAQRCGICIVNDLLPGLVRIPVGVRG